MKLKKLNFKKLFDDAKRLKGRRKSEYVIKFDPEFHVQDHHFHFMIIPTIYYVPWMYCHPNWHMINIMWLNFEFSFFRLVPIPKKNDCW